MCDQTQEALQRRTKQHSWSASRLGPLRRWLRLLPSCGCEILAARSGLRPACSFRVASLQVAATFQNEQQASGMNAPNEKPYVQGIGGL